ncbi:MAG: DUF4407 domain-containing protein [Pyrinomonadaceae bacterium]
MINSIRRFFLICSGATVDILEQPECKTELARYAMMGAFVFLTASFAALSGGFALYTGFKKLLLAIPVGLLWGAFIFTLDRFIVSSIRKKQIEDDSSLGHKAWIKSGEILTALPRLVLAGFIAVTVAVPLEMKYFEPEITTQIDETNTEAAKVTAAEAPQTIPELAEVQKELEDKAAQEKKLRERRDSLTDDVKYEGLGVKGPGFTGVAGAGPIFKQRLKDAKQAEDDLANYQTKNQERVQYLTGRLNTLRLELAKKIADKNQLRANGDGFLARFKALSQLAADGPIRNVTLFLVILLTLIETTPVLIKLFAKRGPYDDLLDALEHKVYFSQQVEISNFNSDTNMELELYEAKVEARRQLESQLIRETLSPHQVENLAAEDIEEAQTEIAKATIGRWKWKEMRTVHENP